MGKPLPMDVRAKMEQAFGHDFSRVRIHEGRHPAAGRAIAVTQAENIHFAPGNYRPDSHDGQSLLGHELTHVVQQRAGQVAAPQGKGFPVNENLALEAEADRAGARAARGEAAHVSGGGQGQRTTPGDAAHASGCGCAGCHTSPAASASSAKVFQLEGCKICGSGKHRASNCPENNKVDRDEHQQQTKVFHQAKKETLESLKKQPVATTSAFSSKHVATSSSDLNHRSTQVAKTRKWGGGGESGKSTVAVMTPQQQADEQRFALEGLKMSESSVGATSGTLSANMGVNKPTKFNYVTKTSTVNTDKTGQRKVVDENEKLAQPVLGLKGTQIHHLHGLDEED
jgi:hypothetical protein